MVIREMECERDAPIVVGVDGRAPSRAALRWAVGESARRHCGVRAILAATGPVADLGGAVKALTDAVHGSVPAADRAGMDVRLEWGDAGDVLVTATEDAQLLVLGGHDEVSDRDGIAGYCLRRAHCPVVVLPAGQ